MPRDAQPLSFSIHTLPTPGSAAEVQHRTHMGRIKMLLILLVCASPVIASYYTYYVVRPEARNNYGSLIQPSVELPKASQLPLTDLQGRTVDPKTLKDQWLLVTVADGACAERCEQLLYAQRQLREVLGKDKDRLDRVWLVTGEHTPRAELLPALSQATVLRTSRDAVAAWLKPEAGHALEEHLYLVDPMGMWMMRFPVQFDPAKVKRDLERMMRASASWDRAGRDPAIVGGTQP